MYFLRECVGTITVPSDYNTVYDKLLRKLEEMHFEVEMQNKNKGRIVIICLSNFFNMIMWKCWSEKLIFKLKETEKNRTRIDIIQVPNLFRIRVKKGEKLVDLDNLVSLLQKP